MKCGLLGFLATIASFAVSCCRMIGIYGKADFPSTTNVLIMAGKGSETIEIDRQIDRQTIHFMIYSFSSEPRSVRAENKFVKSASVTGWISTAENLTQYQRKQEDQ